MPIDLVERAVVTAQAPPYHVFAMILGAGGGQGPTLPVQVLSSGPRDAVRGHFPELPTPGTHGLVHFPSRDVRSGFWGGSYSPSIPNVSVFTPGQGGSDYHVWYGGGISWRGADGSWFEEFPDGTVVRAGPSIPQPTRTTVDGSQTPQQTAYPLSERVQKAPQAFPVAVTHPSGSSLSLSPSGAWTVTVAAGQAMTLTGNNCTVQIDAGGNIRLTTQGSVIAEAAAEVSLKAPLVVASNGGPAQAVQLADNSSSTVFRAQ